MVNSLAHTLSDHDLDIIYAAQLQLLDEIGVKIEHEHALDLLADAGARVNRVTSVVRFSPDLVEACLAKVPDKVIYGGRRPEDDIELRYDQEHFYTRTVSGTEMYQDPDTGRVRRASMQDLRDWIRLIDALDYDIVTSVYPDPNEVPIHIRDIRAIQNALENSTKPVAIGPYDEVGFRYMLDLVMAVRGKADELRQRPLMNVLIASISPMVLPANQVELIFMGSDHGIPLELMPMPIAGISAPATIAGVVTIAGAEALAMNAVAQLNRPGSPVLYAPRTGYLDMQVGVYAVGLEYGMISAAQAMLARRKYRIPSNVFGPHTTSVVNDHQSMIESMLCSIFPVFAGATIVGGAGSIEGGITADPIHVTMADEILKFERKAVRGYEVSDETIGLDLLRKVGIGKDFLSEDHTLKHFRQEFYHCPLFDRRYRADWLAAGGKDMQARSREKTLDLMRNHQVDPLPDAVLKQMQDVVDRAAKEVAP